MSSLTSTIADPKEKIQTPQKVKKITSQIEIHKFGFQKIIAWTFLVTLWFCIIVFIFAGTYVFYILSDNEKKDFFKGLFNITTNSAIPFLAGGAVTFFNFYYGKKED